MLRTTMFLIMGTLGLVVHAQCPEAANVTSNDFCYYLSWESPPSPLPDTLTSDGNVYLLSSGTGNIDDPAIYQSGGGGGACSSHQNPFSGTLTLDGFPCDFTSGTLPLTLLSFDAKKIADNRALLSWSSTNQQNVRVVEVQKSTQSIPWKTIGNVLAEGNNQNAVFNYAFEDNDIGIGTNILYRLKIIDWDNSFTMSNIATLSGTVIDEPQYKISQTGIITIFIPNNFEDFSVVVYDIQGRKIIAPTQSINNGIIIDLTYNKQGLYFIRLTAPGYESALKVVR